MTTSDIRNKAEYDASSIGLSGGIGEHIGRDANGNQKAGAPGTPVPNNGKVSANAPIALIASGESSSTTQSGISGATVKINDDAKQQALTGQTAAQAIAAINTDVSSDRDGSNKLKPIFNQQEIQAGFDITAKFVQNVGVYLESRAKDVDDKRKEAAAALNDANDTTRSIGDREASHEEYVRKTQEAREIANDWGAGGTYRQIATALVAGVSGSVGGSTSQFAQNMVVNYVQQQGAGYIGKLVVSGDIKEGDPIHAALHAIAGCAGAAASGQACSAGAMGGAASSILTNLFKDTDANETQEQREAKRNIITSLVTGIAAVTDPTGAASATNAAIANVDNNWLATQQIVQAAKEINEAKNPLEALKIIGKWQLISGRQDLLTGTGFAKGFTDGMAGSGLGTLDSAIVFLRDPAASWAAVSEFASSKEAFKQLGAVAYAALQSQVSQVGEALEKGGDANAENLGNQMGQTLALVISLVAGGGTDAAQGALALSRMGIDVSSTVIKKIFTSTAEAGGLEAKVVKLEKLGRDMDVPELPAELIPPAGVVIKDLPRNLSVRSLNDIEDPAINPSSIRDSLSLYVKSGDAGSLSVATGSVEIDGQTAVFAIC